jgi:hypothetical protein
MPTMLRHLVIAVPLLACSAVSSAAQDTAPCTVASVYGRAFVSAPGAGRHLAVVGLGMGANATLRTTAYARVTLRCPDDLRVVVGSSTEIAVARLVADSPQPVALRLLRGIAGFLFDGAGDGVQVRTPSAVAAVRSTEWAMRVENDASAVFARDGTVFVQGSDGSVSLGPGDGVDVSAAGDVGQIVLWGQARIDLFATLLGPDW